MKNVKQNNKSNTDMILNVYVETISRMLECGKVPQPSINRYKQLLEKNGLKK